MQRTMNSAMRGAAAQGGGSLIDRWADRWFGLRNRLLANPDFHRFASAFLPTRWIAKRRAMDLFDLVAGFVYSQVLLACVQLDLFNLLSKGPQTLAALAPRLGLTEVATERLLVAAVSLQLIERRNGGRYGLGLLGAPMAGNAALAAMVRHHSALYSDLADPVALLRGEASNTQLAGYWPYAGEQPPHTLKTEQVAEYSALMSVSQTLVAREILDAYPLKHHAHLLDIGGGEGTFLMQAATCSERLKLALFDLPAVAKRANEKLTEAGLGARAFASGGDFFSDPLPPGADIATLIRVVHDHDDARVATLLKAAHAALAPGGTLLLAEPMAATPGAQAMGDAYFGFYLLAMGRGQPRSAEQLTALLHNAGFVDVRLLPNRMPLQTRILLAKTRH